MDKRPPNPRRLSRKLFAKKPLSVEAVRTGTTPSYALGDVEEVVGLRSDIDKVKMRAGEDFATYALFVDAVKEGKFKEFLTYTRGGTNPSYDEYKDWRRKKLDRMEFRHKGNIWGERWFRGPRHKTGWIDYTEDSPLLQHEIKEIEKKLERKMTEEEKKALFEEDREKLMAGVGRPFTYRRGTYGEEDLPFSMTSEIRNRKATELHEARKGMTRAQQRKLGRVIRDGKTGPMTRTRKEVEYEEEKRNLYRSYEYKPTRYDYKKNVGTLKYSYGYNIPAAVNVSLTPEERKRMLRMGEGLPEQKIFNVERTFDNKEDMEKAIEEMKQKTKGYGLFNPNSYYEVGEKKLDRGSAEFIRLKQIAKERGRKELGEYWDDGTEMVKYGGGFSLPSTTKEKYDVKTGKSYIYMSGDKEAKVAKRDHRGRPTHYEHTTHAIPHYGVDEIKVITKRPKFFSKKGWRFWEGKQNIRDYVDDKAPANPIWDEDARMESQWSDRKGKAQSIEDFLVDSKLLNFSQRTSKGEHYSRELPKPNKLIGGKKYVDKNALDNLITHGEIEKIPLDSKRGVLALRKNLDDVVEEHASKGMVFGDHRVGSMYVDKDGKIRKRQFAGKKKVPIKKVRRVRRLDRDVMNNPNFQLRVARGKGRRVFHIEEGKTKGWKQTGINKYTKQSENWKALDVDTTPADQLQLRGLRDRRTGGMRLIGRGVNPRRLDRGKEYKSARSEALIQMRINETAGIRDLKTKQEKDIKEIRISEAQKALNLKLAKETAEKTTEALKAKNAGLTHSYNVNVRNQSAATLIGSDPDALKGIIVKAGGLALIKSMIRRGEITDLSTLTALADRDPKTKTEHQPEGRKYISSKQLATLERLLMEGGSFVEGQEYFYRTLDDFGRTLVRRGYLNKGGERKDNLELMYITTHDDGSTTTETFLVPKTQILKPDDHTSTTSSGKRQPQTEPRQLSQFELDLFGEEKEAELPQDVSHFGVPIHQDPKTGVKSLVKTKGAGIADPSPKVGGSILQTLKHGGDFETMGGDLQLELDAEEEEGTSEEGFVFGSPLGQEPTRAPQPEPEPTLEPSPYGIKPKKQPTIDEELDLSLGMGEAQQIAEELGAHYPQKPAGTEEMIKALEVAHDEPIEGEEEEPSPLPDPADILEAQQLLQKGKEGPLKEGIARSPSPKPKKEEEPKKAVKISEEVKELFAKTPAPLSPINVPESWDASKDDVPDELLKENWSFSGRGLKERLGEGGTQEVPEGYTAIWTTKWGERNNQTALLVSEADIYYLIRGLKGVSIRNDKGRKNPISDASLKSFYRKVVENIRNGVKQTPFNNKQFLRGLDMIDPYESEEESE